MPTRKQAVDISQSSWLAYIVYRATLIKYTLTIPWEVRWHINVATLNIRGGFDLFTKRSYITHKCLEKDSNHKKPHQIKWDTCHWPESDTDKSLLTELDNNYTFHATTPNLDPPSSGRGIILLSHNRWNRRKTRTTYGRNERWIAQTYSTAEGTLTILAWYGRLSISHHNFHSERLEVISYVQQCHRSNETILLLGDFNLSYNLPQHHQQSHKMKHYTPF
jgi:hypothetical protein